MIEVEILTTRGTTEAGEPLEIILYQPPGKRVIEAGNPAAGLPPIYGPALPLAVSGWYGSQRQPFEAWLLGEEYVNLATGQHGPAIRQALPSPVARGRW